MTCLNFTAFALPQGGKSLTLTFIASSFHRLRAVGSMIFSTSPFAPKNTSCRQAGMQIQASSHASRQANSSKAVSASKQADSSKQSAPAGRQAST
eukprot:scaffold310797_cov12-Tisochrysis_lutea.AAC.1